ncbi:acyltransferase family protein [Thermocrispum municipale]|uniref:acyltransferase family protein n=1 Tax=Thermocrispum municipale TaxID=37926 RepID=UPI0004106FE4|nr:acyltransferase family protein [Thermocrispum municipale]
MVAQSAQVTTGRGPATPTKGTRAVRGFRPDVEGLRAVAVGLVLLYHAGLTFVPGGFVGVDVFFVISGFLITGLLVKEAERTGRISLAGFYARRAKRLLPAAALVLAVTALLVFLVVPRTQWTGFGGDIAAAALYFVNWRLAANEVDYLAEDAGVSPVQHFWSLAVEEQFYFVWPVLFILAMLVARKLGSGLRRTLCAGLAVVAVPSLAWSVYYTVAAPQQAFFVTTTRMWELSIGAAVALGAARLAKLPHPVALVLGWAGLAAIVASAVVLNADTPWPGYHALLPTLGTAAVIAAGPAAGPRGPIALLGRPTWTWIGGLSYSLYLWHWPLIVIATVAFDGLTQLEGLAVALLSVLPAWATLRLVENPVRFNPTFSARPWLALRLGALLSAIGLACGFGLIGATALATDEPVANPLGAAAIRSVDNFRIDTVADGANPDPLEAVDDVPDAYARGCQVDQTSAEPVSCEYGDPHGKVDIVLVGDSKALQWISALDTIGEQRGWRVRTFTKSSCPFTPATIALHGKPYTSCTQWGRNVEAELLRDPPDLVLTSQFRSTALTDPTDPDSEATQEQMASALRERWSRLVDAGSKIGVLRDNPKPPESVQPVYECVDANRDDVTPCVFPRSVGEQGSGQPAQTAAARGLRGVHIVDMNDYICPGSSCPPVIGDVLVYRQGTHLTRTYVETLEPRLAEKLEPLVSRS